MLKKLCACSVLCLALLVSVAKAATVTNLYRVQLPIANKTSVLRQSALPQALQMVLVKVSGLSTISNVADVAAALQQAQNYLQQYAYQNTDQGLMIDLRFSRTMINNLLRSSGQGLWGQNRPLLLIWFVEKTNNGLKVLNDASNPTVKLLSQYAKQRALPIIFPLMDITDLQTVSATALFNGNQQAILKASARYVPDAILVIRQDALDPKALSSTWMLFTNAQKQDWQVNGDNQLSLLQAGLNDVTDSLATQYAVKSSQDQGGPIVLQVSGLKNSIDYVRLEKYLQSLAAIKAASLVSLSQNGAVFSLSLSGDVKTLTQEIHLGHVLQAAQTQQQSNNGTLMYQYRG